MKTPWQLFKSFFLNAFTRGEDPQNQQRWIPPYPIAGINLTQDQSLSLSTVWACIDIIAKSVASCQWCIYEPVPGTKRRTKIDNDWKFWMLNTRPNPEMTAIGFREAMFFQAIPFGNAYAEIVRDAGGRVIQLWPLLSDRMQPRRNRETWELEYHYTQADGQMLVYGQRQIFHLRGPGLYGLMGENIIARAARTLAVAAAQERFSASFFGQGAQPIGTLTYPHKLDDVTYERLKNDWATKYKGPDNAHKPLILESGMKFEAISIDPAKAQLSEDKKFTVAEICRWFGVPPHKVQHLENATFSNIEHLSIGFVRDALRPWERRICQEADFKLFDQNRAPWKYTEIDLAPLMRGDANSRASAQASWRQNGIKTANEIRAEEGLDDAGDEGDVLLVQANLTTIDRIINPPEPLAPPALPPGDEDTEEIELEEDDISAVKRTAIRAALKSSLDRYGRRLNNRKAALNSKSDSERLTAIIEFRASQFKVVVDEMSHFNEIIVSLFGRELTVKDAERAVLMFENGEDFAHALPSTPVHA